MGDGGGESIERGGGGEEGAEGDLDGGVVGDGEDTVEQALGVGGLEDGEDGAGVEDGGRGVRALLLVGRGGAL